MSAPRGMEIRADRNVDESDISRESSVILIYFRIKRYDEVDRLEES